MMYQQIDLASGKAIGTPGPPPQCLAGLSDASLASPDFAPPTPDLAGQAWWPVIVTTPGYDSRKQIPDGTLSVGTPDAGSRTVPATANIRDLTSDEIAALPPRQATFTQISTAIDALNLTTSAATAWEKLKPIARAYLGAHYADGMPETSPKVAKFVGLIAATQTSGPVLTVASLFDKAVTF